VSLAQVTIVGTGLIGASVGLAAAAKGRSVNGWDPDPEALALAERRGAVTPAGSLESALAEAELVVVAAPVSALPSQVASVLARTGERATVTDVGSTKAGVVAAAAGVGRFVGGHPMAGSEARGAENASAGLFEGATWFLTPTADTDAARHRQVHGFVAELGAFPVAIDPAAHDRLVALISHLPHVLANLIVNRAGAGRIAGHDPLASAGGSLRDMTRIAGANPRMWTDLLLDNAEAVAMELADLRGRIAEVESALGRRDHEFLAGFIAEAARNRRRMLEQSFTDAGALHRVSVHVPDRPGVFAEITRALGAERINIEDFGLEHISPERGGTVTLLVAGSDQARRAAELLTGQGYRVVAAAVLDED
jgi:prephenate dehydrogenase